MNPISRAGGTATASLVLGAALLLPTSAAAFSGAFIQQHPLGNCRVWTNLDTSVAPDQGALVELEKLSGGSTMAGGSYFVPGTVGPTAFAPVTAAAIQACGLQNVTILSADGAQGTFATDGYIGVRFRATDPADHMTYDYEFALSGVVATTVVATKVLHAGPTTGPATPTQQLIGSAQQARMNQLATNQPDLIGLLDPRGPQVTMSANEGLGQMDLSATAGPLWGRVAGGWARAGSARSDYVLGTLGTHYRFSENAILGAMVEFDHFGQDDGAASMTGTGWLAGPYAVARIPGKELTFEAMALWGRTDNRVSPDGSYADSVDGQRSFAQIKVATRFDYGQVVVRPRLALRHMSEGTEAYTDALSLAVAGVRSAESQAQAGLAFERTFETTAGALTLTGALDGIWTDTTTGPVSAYEDGRGRLSLGMRYDLGQHGNLGLSAYLDGLGQDGYEARGAAIDYGLRF
ncbi:MAG: autotransporter outer membrane beta-barrel domain-containing protein [Defluviimonas sp.]|uniref:autotransporter outer membrane beta-barrel domain-containing protein n=1 Tax=Albidovulum sp. TaxID=1872424 RepID=UPI001D479E77|nr:autotransporter outer membrane beta-barrel domain-containing protein [Paracoccaceae bacterium]MCC0065082.1 autotransporter outer membrane beta-barrel domain-containing protein [Defluviimonas sp.]